MMVIRTPQVEGDWGDSRFIVSSTAKLVVASEGQNGQNGRNSLGVESLTWHLSWSWVMALCFVL